MLERLLDEPNVDVEALSGASAGAMNAAVFAHGYMCGGRRGAQSALEAFWNAVAASRASVLPGTAGAPDAATSAYVSLTRFFSPYQLNPLNVNPLRDIVEKQIDFVSLRSRSPVRLFVSATRVKDAALRIFTERDLTVDALLASACIPSLHHAVTIDGDIYWDGALTANPPLSPLVYECDAPELLVVALMRDTRGDAAPSTADAIIDRFNEISFSSALATELKSISYAIKRAQARKFAWGALERRLRDLRLQVLNAASEVATLDAATRYKTDTAFIEGLREQGRGAAERWLRGKQHRAEGYREPLVPIPAVTALP